MTEEEALRLFLDYFKETGQGKWEGNPGPNPPDFLIVNPESNSLAAVEHTRFYWPPQDLTFSRALQSVKQDVNKSTSSCVHGLFGVSIEHDNREAFSESFRALPRGKRSGVSKWLAQEIVGIGTEMVVGEEEQLLNGLHLRVRRAGPDTCAHCRQGAGGGQGVSVRGPVRDVAAWVRGAGQVIRGEVAGVAGERATVHASQRRRRLRICRFEHTS